MCTGQQTEQYYPLQFQEMPFFNGSGIVTKTFTSSRYAGLPTITECHHRFSGPYILNSFLTTVNQTTPFSFVTVILYSDALAYRVTSNEVNTVMGTGNAMGHLNDPKCTPHGATTTLNINLVLFNYPSTITPINDANIAISNNVLTCTTKTFQCHGSATGIQYTLQLPIKGKFQNQTAEFIFSVTGTKITV
ncbi:unnamed protein product [Didymodactylos carnosus]|uniref:Uncharacterized protein n=1 Tax=Didymodactylos carnosus TaxID=1234261 RepID=A0A814RIP8_9BILA|nr:unnamed protein product [Didymodactylos carnosus]CAF3896781.1 unnamed protein product [Didymodactylos carnosus]